MSDLESEGIPDLDSPPPGLEDEYNQVEGMMPPGDRLLYEQERREEPDVLSRADEYELHGRLIEPDQGVAGLDRERDPVAGMTGDDEALSAEEAAMHITDIP
jgi:hypothetical protein